MTTKKTAKKTKRQKLLLASLWCGIIGLSGGIAGGVASTWMGTKHCEFAAAPTETSYTLNIWNNDESVSANSALAGESPLFFQTTNTGEKATLLDLLNSANLPFLSVEALNNLTIVGYQINANLTPFDNSVPFSALQLKNNDSLGVDIRTADGNYLLARGKTVWVYLADNKITFSVDEPSAQATLFTLTGLSTAYTMKDGQAVAPSLPVETTYELATAKLSDDAFMLNAVETDIAGLLNNLNTYNNGKKTLSVTYSGSQIPMYVSSPLTATGISYSNATVTIQKLSGALTVEAGGQSINVVINSTNLKLPVQALVMSENSVYPALTSNSLKGLTFMASGQAPAYSANLMFGYVLGANTPLSVTVDGQAFTAIPISFGYLFYNYWMKDHPGKISYGSVYENTDNTWLEPKSVQIPTNWVPLDLDLETATTVAVAPSQTFLNAIDTAFSTKTLNLTVTSTNYPSLYTDLAQLSNFKNLPSYLTVDSFDVLATVSANDNLTLQVTGLSLSNQQSESGNLSICYILDNNKYYAVYPSGKDNLITTIPVDNISLTLNLTDLKSAGAWNLPVSLNLATLFPDSYFDAELFSANLSNKTVLATLTSALANGFNLGANFSISDLRLTASQINSFVLTYNGVKPETLTLNGTTYAFYPKMALTVSKTVTFTGFLSNYAALRQTRLNKTYSTVLSTNFLKTGETAVANNSAILDLLTSTIGFTGASVTDYTSTATTTASATLKITSLTLEVKSAFYYDGTLIKPGTTTINTANFVLIDLPTELTESNNGLWSAELAKCQTWLDGLSLADVTADFQVLSQLKNETTTQPAPATLNYKDFSCDLTNYTDGVVTLSQIQWTIWGTANVYGTHPISIGLAQLSTPIKIKLVPVLYWTENGKTYSYPSITTTSTMKKTFYGIVSEDTALATNLDYNVTLPVFSTALSSLRYGYYLETTGSVNANFGSGVVLNTDGTDAADKPYLNLSNIFNSASMSGQCADHIGSLASPTKISDPQVALTSVYGSVLAGTQDTATNADEISETFLGFFRAISEDDFTNVFNFTLPSGLTLVSANWDNTDQDIDLLTLKNSTSNTYELNLNGTLDFIAPDSQTTFSTNLKVTGIQNLSADSTVSPGKVEISGEHSYWERARYLVDDYAYLYPLLWTQDNDNCLKYDWWKADYRWDEGDKSFTITQTSWTAYISSVQKAKTIYIYDLWDLLLENADAQGWISSYTAHVADGNIVVTALTINGVTYSTNLMLTPNHLYTLA